MTCSCPVAADGISVPYVSLYHHQRQFFNLDCAVQGFVGGRGTGKTKIGCLKVLYSAKNKSPWLIISPDTQVIEDTTWPQFEETARQLGLWVRGVRSPVHRAWIKTFDGGETNVLFRGAEKPEKLRGPSKAGIWIDEAGLVPPEAYLYSLPMLRFMTATGTAVGPMMLTFTPVPPVDDPETKRREPHWTFKVFFDLVCEAAYGDSESAHVANGDVLYCDRWWRPRYGTGLVKVDTKDNPFLPKTFVDVLEAKCSAEPELYGEWVA